MAIGTTAALLGSAAIGAGASALGAKSANKAAARATDAQLQATRENNALQRELYGKNEAYLAPYSQNGILAGNAIMELLGFAPQSGGALAQYPTPQTAPQPQGALAQWAVGPGTPNDPDIYRGRQDGGPIRSGGQFTFSPQASNMPTQTGAAMTLQVPQQQPGGAKSAFDRYRESTGYQFRLNEGFNGINSGYAANGLLESGAAQKALLRYGQDYGSNEFGKYIGYLANQQGVGLSGASALAGVGQNFANSISANNQNSADAIGNAALIRGTNNSNMWAGIGNSLGGVLGGLGSSYGGGINTGALNSMIANNNAWLSRL